MSFLYALLISLHPPSFRKRFAPEMLWIFDIAFGSFLPKGETAFEPTNQDHSKELDALDRDGAPCLQGSLMNNSDAGVTERVFRKSAGPWTLAAGLSISSAWGQAHRRSFSNLAATHQVLSGRPIRRKSLSSRRLVGMTELELAGATPARIREPVRLLLGIFMRC